ncbi:MAG: hypothetical protein CVV00_15450, partial [Firmicutes bacterium HGW-Firmicutes-5]
DDVKQMGVNHIDALEIIEINRHKNRPQQAQADDGDADLMSDSCLKSFHKLTLSLVKMVI